MDYSYFMSALSLAAVYKAKKAIVRPKIYIDGVQEAAFSYAVKAGIVFG